MPAEPVKVLTIGGSDSGGAAGIQADLKTFTALHTYGMSVITAVTAQNSYEVRAVHPLPADFVTQQLEAVLSDYGAAAVKTGFVGRVDLLEAIAAGLAAYPVPHVVIDPVLVNHRGQSMFPPTVAAAYRELLFPLATLMTPNRHEAALLSERPVQTVVEAREAAETMLAAGARAVLVKGINAGTERVDVLHTGRETHLLPVPLIETENTHGSGDTLSAAIAVFLARGEALLPAVQQAQQFTAGAIERAAGWHMGAGHGPLSHFP